MRPTPSIERTCPGKPGHASHVKRVGIGSSRASIIQKLAALRVKDQGLKVFGASSHEYKLNVPLTEMEVQSVEVKYRFSLPKDYRWFVTTIGNGGAGPFYGLFPLGMNDDGFDLASWETVGLVGALDQPFKHAKAWNLPTSFWEGEPDPGEDITEKEEAKLWEAWDEKLESEYWDLSVMQGAIPICHEGCALRDWLVVTGPLAGNIWREMRVDNGGIAPLTNPDGTPMTFSAWYVDWLDSNLGKEQHANA